MESPNTESYQKMHKILREQLCARLRYALDFAEEDVASLSLAELLNVAFLVHGGSGSLGNFNVSFGAALKLVGKTMMWQEPEAEPEPAPAPTRVN